MTDNSRPPVVFISYSHDSPEHKQWVADLARRLVSNGVETIFDQWDLRLGDDLPKFMEKAVRDADRVLMICSDIYAQKANGGRGGVGYEAMVVTGELIRDLGTAKFIPVVRQSINPPILPSSVSTRFYVDLSRTDEFDEQFDRLLRELHQAPLSPKPSLGVNPFAADSARPTSIPTSSKATISAGALTPSACYARARDIVLSDDMPAWRALVNACKARAQEALEAWWHRHGSEPPRESNDLVSQSLDGIKAFELLISAALAAVGTGRYKYSNQVALFEEIVMPAGWVRGGYTVRIEMPHAGGYIYQGLHGALCLHTGQLTPAVNLVREVVTLPNSNKAVPIHSIGGYMGWPGALGGDSKMCWSVLTSMVKHWPWLMDVFGSEGDYHRALVAYYTALIVNEYAIDLAAGKQAAFAAPETLRIEVPPHFAASTHEVRRAAYRLLTANPCSVCDVWRSLNVPDRFAIESWDAWLKVYSYWYSRSKYTHGDEFEYLGEMVKYSVSRCARSQPQ